MNEKTKNIVICCLYTIVVITIVWGTFGNNGNYKKQLGILNDTVAQIGQSIEDVRSGLRQQESIIGELVEGQSRLESTIELIGGNQSDIEDRIRGIEGVQYEIANGVSRVEECQRSLESELEVLDGLVRESKDVIDELIARESEVDGDIGAIIATSDRIKRTIELTLQGLKESEDL